MKRLLIILSFLFISAGMFGQSFFKPVPKSLFTGGSNRTIKGSSVFLMRPAITITAVQWNWDKVTKQFNAAAFQSAGLGVGYQHFTALSDGTPFNNYGANLLLLLGTDISAGLTFSGLGIINLGVLYDFTVKQPGILTGVTLKF